MHIVVIKKHNKTCAHKNELLLHFSKMEIIIHAWKQTKLKKNAYLIDDVVVKQTRRVNHFCNLCQSLLCGRRIHSTHITVAGVGQIRKDWRRLGALLFLGDYLTHIATVPAPAALAAVRGSTATAWSTVRTVGAAGGGVGSVRLNYALVGGPVHILVGI